MYDQPCAFFKHKKLRGALNRVCIPLLSPHRSVCLQTWTEYSTSGEDHVIPKPKTNTVRFFSRNLPFEISAEEMYDIFGKFGAIRQIRLWVNNFLVFCVIFNPLPHSLSLFLSTVAALQIRREQLLLSTRIFSMQKTLASTFLVSTCATDTWLSSIISHTRCVVCVCVCVRVCVVCGRWWSKNPTLTVPSCVCADNQSYFWRPLVM